MTLEPDPEPLCRVEQLSLATGQPSVTAVLHLWAPVFVARAMLVVQGAVLSLAPLQLCSARRVLVTPLSVSPMNS